MNVRNDSRSEAAVSAAHTNYSNGQFTDVIAELQVFSGRKFHCRIFAESAVCKSCQHL